MDLPDRCYAVFSLRESVDSWSVGDRADASMARGWAWFI
ncbi:hypothetical protein S7335_1202 [Synechococcus sp. PCC 7335]|nr:hypothetical protein S7335_1202 [Synechococcus sp. PCC 7335]